jgi:hypothetical protein
MLIASILAIFACALIAGAMFLRARKQRNASTPLKERLADSKGKKIETPLERIRSGKTRAPFPVAPASKESDEAYEPGERPLVAAPEVVSTALSELHGFGHAYPVSLLPKFENRSAGALFCAWRKAIGLSESINEGDWLPLGVVGPILVIAGTHADAECAYPAWAVQRVIVTASDYYALATHCANEFVSFREEAEGVAPPVALLVDLPEELSTNLDAARFVQSHFPLAAAQAAGLSAFLTKTPPFRQDSSPVFFDC